MNTPFVSICIPAYNNEKYIGKTIESILKQTYRYLEIVIVDDVSTDNTVDVVKRYEDRRIHLFQNEKNLGMAGNWNRCVELSKGKFVKLICADDMLYPDSIEREVAALTKHQSASMVLSDTRFINQEGKSMGSYLRFPRYQLNEGKRFAKCSILYNNFFGAPCNVMFRRKAFEIVGGFDKEFAYILDFDLWVRMACIGNIAFIPQKLNGFRLRSDSNTGKVLQTDKEEYLGEHKKLVRKHQKEKIIPLSSFEVNLSIYLRRIRSVIYGIYLKLVLNNRRCL